MSPHLSPAADRIGNALHAIFGQRLRSVVAYGPQVENGGADVAEPLSCLALVANLTIADLEASAARAHEWTRHQIATPLLLPEDEFRRSFDAFPLEYGEILRAHQVLFGANPFDGISIERADLRRACEAQIKSHLVHLREAYIGAAGTPRAVADIVTASAPAFGALLRNIARLNGSVEKDWAAATRDGARAAQLADTLVTSILTLERPTGVKAVDAARLFPEYLAAVEQLARYVDTWR